MAHSTTENSLSPAEKEFQNLMRQGDDFYKIELLRHAKSWYKKALEKNIDPDTVKQKISACDQLLSKERKIVFILLGIALVAILIWYLSGS